MLENSKSFFKYFMCEEYGKNNLKELTNIFINSMMNILV